MFLKNKATLTRPIGCSGTVGGYEAELFADERFTEKKALPQKVTMPAENM